MAKIENATPNKFIRLGMTNEMFETLAQIKADDGISVSEFIRRAIQEKFDRMDSQE